jgi:hypothetical protein
VRLLAERLGIVEGPPAGVLLFTLSPFLTAVYAFVGFVVALLRLRGKATPHDERYRDVSPTFLLGLALGLLREVSLRCPKMKRIVRRVLLVALVLLELWLLTGFLPERWQEKMYSRIDDIWPSHSYDYSRVTHPNLDYELQPLKPYGLALVAVLVVLNGGAIYAVWRRRDL